MSSQLAPLQRRWSLAGRSWTILVSIALHLAVVGVVAWGGKQPRVRQATQVTVSRPKPKPKVEEKKPEEEKPKPPPPPPVARPKPVEVAAPVVPAPAAAPAPVAAARVSSGLTMSNGPGGGGLAVAGLSNAPPQPQVASGPTDDRHSRTPPTPLPVQDDACDAPDTKPRPSGTLQVDYPQQARADGIEGRIQVRIHVGGDGAVLDVEVVNSIEPSIDAVVLGVLRTWKFLPATHCGKPVPGVLAWAQRFELGD